MKTFIKKSYVFALALICLVFIGQSIIKADEDSTKVKSLGISRGVNSFDISSSVSKSQLTNYTDQLNVNFTIKHLDSASGLKAGTLVIDFNGMSFDVVNYAKNATANSNVISGSYDQITKKLTVKLKDPISTGTQFDYSVVVRANPFAVHNDQMKASATLNGKNTLGVDYAQESVETDNVTFSNPSATVTETIDPLNPQWKWNKLDNNVTQTDYMFPGQTKGGGLYQFYRLLDTSNASFKNFKVELKRSTNAPVSSFILYNNVMVGGKNVGANEMRNIYGNLISSNNLLQSYEFGPINGNVDKSLLFYIGNPTVPLTAQAGDEYKFEYTVFDGDDKLSTFTSIIKVKELQTSVTFENYAAQSKVEEKQLDENNTEVYDYFDWKQRNVITTAGVGVKDYTVTLKIPEGVKLESITPPSNANFFKKVSVYVGGNWIVCTSKIGNSFNLSGISENATKIKYEYNNILMYSGELDYNHTSIKVKNISNVENTVIPLNVESVTYTDHTGTQQSISNISTYDKSITVVNKLPKGKVQAIVMDSNGAAGSFDTINFNGDKLYQSLRVGTFENKLDNPYLYVVVPKGVTIPAASAATTNFGKPYMNGFMTYTFNTLLSPIVQPRSSNDISYKTFELADDKVLHFWSISGLSLKGELTTTGVANLTQVMGSDLQFKLESLKSGSHDVEFGMGSLTNDDYDIYNGVPYRGLTHGAVDASLKAVLPELKTANGFKTKKTINVGVNNSVTAKMEIKGSEDTTYIDAASSSATSIPGKGIDYRVTLKNEGTNDLTDFQAVDILPYVGDKLTTNTSTSRGSQFNINLGQNIKVLVDGQESLDAFIRYSTSNDPIRFDASGAAIGTGTWTNTPPSDMSTVKAIMVVMPSKPFAINSTIQLLFSGTVPADAPRNGELAYNTVAIKAKTTTVSGEGLFVSEPAKGGVKSKKPATDLELSGSTFMDFDKSGTVNGSDIGYNGVKLNLYEKVNDVFTLKDSVITAPNSASVPGKFAFTGMGNGTYKIEAELKANSSFVTTGNNSFVVQTDPSKAWLKYNGLLEFSIDDLAGTNPKTITDFSAPFYVTTPFSGSIKFVDKDGTIVTGNTFGKDFSVQLQNATGIDIAGANATSANDGTFSIAGIEANTTASYKLAFTKPSGKSFVYPNSNVAGMNTTSGVYAITNVIPGNAGIADILISDTDNPTVSITKDKAINPASITLAATDATTTASASWIIKLNGIQTSSGNGAVTLPTTNGLYTIEAIATDSAKNVSTTQSTSFTVDTTNPVIVVDSLPTNNINLTKLNVSATDNLDTATKISYVLTNTTTNNVQTINDVTGTQDLLSKITVDGAYTLVINAKDSANNAATQVSKSFTIDKTIPVISTSILPITNINPTKVEISVTDNLDTATKISYVLTNTTTNNVQTINDVTGTQDLLSKITIDGEYTLVIKAKDSGDNSAVTVTKTFRVDKTQPVINTSITSKTIKVGTSSVNFKTAYTATALDAYDGSITNITVEGTYNLNVPGSYPLKFKATDTAGNIGEKSIVLVVEQIEISGVIYNDENYNSTKDDTNVISDIVVQLINNDDDIVISTSTTNALGEYSFALPGSETVTNYAIKVSDTQGYLLANKGAGSILDLTTLKSDSMIIQGSDYLNKDIGLASNLSATIAPASLKVYLGDTLTNSVSITNGSIFSATLDNSNIAITSVTGGYDIEGLVLGDTILSVVVKDGYNRNSVTRTQAIKVIPIPKVIFDTHGGSNAPTTLEVKTGVSVDLTTITKPTKKGYMFAGWYNDSTLYSGTFLMPETDLTLTAKWTPVLSSDGANEKFSALNMVSPASGIKNINIALVKAKAKPNIYLVDENNVKVQNIAIKNIDKSKVQAKQGSYPLYIISESGQKHLIYVSVGKTISPKTNTSSALDSSSFTISLKDFSKHVKNKTIQQEIIKRSYTKSWNIKTNKPVGKISVSYTKPNKAGKFKITIKANALSIKSAANTQSDELTNEVTMTVTSDLPEGGTNTILLVLSILSSVTLIGTRIIKRKA